VENDLAYRLLRLEQRLASYEQLHAQELGDMRQELEALKRQVVLRPSRHGLAPIVQVDAALCTGCGECVPACPQSMFELKVVGERRLAGVIVRIESERAQACTECRLGKPPCIAVCTSGVIILQ
jgi:ferredoxin